MRLKTNIYFCHCPVFWPGSAQYSTNTNLCSTTSQTIIWCLVTKYIPRYLWFIYCRREIARMCQVPSLEISENIFQKADIHILTGHINIWTSLNMSNAYVFISLSSLLYYMFLSFFRNCCVYRHFWMVWRTADGSGGGAAMIASNPIGKYSPP